MYKTYEIRYTVVCAIVAVVHAQTENDAINELLNDNYIEIGSPEPIGNKEIRSVSISMTEKEDF